MFPGIGNGHNQEALNITPNVYNLKVKCKTTVNAYLDCTLFIPVKI